MAARDANGIYPAKGNKNNMAIRIKTACIIPAIGVLPPERILVTVRDIAPAAGIPPNRADAILATPCPTSSQLERWRRSIIPSDTTADNNDSTQTRKAMVKIG